MRLISAANRSRQRSWLRVAVVSMVLASPSLLLAPVAVFASGHDDHEKARAGVQAGEILPLPLVLERLQASHPGQLLGLELEREDGRWIYEIKLLQADGQLLKLEVDAGTAQVLKSRRRDSSRRERRDVAAGEDPAMNRSLRSGRK